MRRESKIFLFTFLLFLVLITPIPGLRICHWLEDCPPWGSFNWSPSLIQRTWNLFYPVRSQSTDPIPIIIQKDFQPETEEDMFESESTPTAIPVPTYEPFEQWDTYTNGRFNYAIKYPKSAELDYNNKNIISGQETGIYLKGQDFLEGGWVSIKILENPNSFPLNQLGNVRYGSGCGVGVKDLAWKETQFLNKTILINSNLPPLCGDSTLHNIYLLNHQGKIFALEVSYQDKINNTYFQDMTSKILSTFRFID